MASRVSNFAWSTRQEKGKKNCEWDSDSQVFRFFTVGLPAVSRHAPEMYSLPYGAGKRNQPTDFIYWNLNAFYVVYQHLVWDLISNLISEIARSTATNECVCVEWCTTSRFSISPHHSSGKKTILISSTDDENKRFFGFHNHMLPHQKHQQ